ncbi:hypothetical protein WH47_00602 [Habropoda laboriosa]|uniref:Uncharacterized protein n=1 Tax=Habropoda laboriosa TaxID=597456 RepID=A0A0L7RHJ9_9HYME|nr:hypothetical protein WH47_00602 [Habropoda laboriosa]
MVFINKQGKYIKIQFISNFPLIYIITTNFYRLIILAFAGSIGMTLVILSCALPIQWGACYLTLAGNVVVYLTLVGLFVTVDQDDIDYNTMLS